MAADFRSREEQERTWWERWRASDFSWDGLAGKVWRGWSRAPDGSIVETESAPPGSEPASLQDYWRDEESHLIAGDGKRWTRAHAPAEWLDGTPAKLAWSADQKAELRTLLQRKLTEARDTQMEGEPWDRKPKGADRRAQFRGVVLFQMPSQSEPMSATFERVAFLERGFLESFAGDADFDMALFKGSVRFGGSVAGQTSFSEVIVLGYGDFSGLSCGGEARFTNVMFNGGASFYSAKVAGDFTLGGSNFLRPADFTNVEFSNSLYVHGAVFAARVEVRNAKVLGETSFSYTEFQGAALFDGMSVRGRLEFAEAKFQKGVRFQNCTVGGFANFQRMEVVGFADFSRQYSDTSTTFNDKVSFYESTFADEARFDGVTFEADAYFDQVVFKNDVSFDRATILQCISFMLSRFGNDFTFRYVKFGEACDKQMMRFEGAVFASMVDFYETRFPAKTQNFSAAFIGARFQEWVDFRGCGTHWIAALHDAIVDRKLVIEHLGDDAASKEFRKTMLSGALLAAKTDRDKRVETETTNRMAAAEKDGGKPERITGAEKRAWLRQARDKRLSELEGGCRVAKAAMGRDRNEQIEQRYYRFQLIARRRQPGVPMWEKAFSTLYGMTSDYGMSMVTPLAALAGTIVLFAVGYWAGANALHVAQPTTPIGESVVADAWAAMTFSWNNTFRPLSALTSDTVRPDDETWLSALLYKFGPGYGFGIRALATLQSLLAIALAFLFALAVRRRFQMS